MFIPIKIGGIVFTLSKAGIGFSIPIAKGVRVGKTAKGKNKISIRSGNTTITNYSK